MMIYVDGAAIQRMREARGMSQNALAEIAGVSQSMIAHIEAGKKQPGVPALKQLADCFHLPMDDLLIVADANYREAR